MKAPINNKPTKMYEDVNFNILNQSKQIQYVVTNCKCYLLIYKAELPQY